MIVGVLLIMIVPVFTDQPGLDNTWPVLINHTKDDQLWLCWFVPPGRNLVPSSTVEVFNLPNSTFYVRWMIVFLLLLAIRPSCLMNNRDDVHTLYLIWIKTTFKIIRAWCPLSRSSRGHLTWCLHVSLVYVSYLGPLGELQVSALVSPIQKPCWLLWRKTVI